MQAVNPDLRPLNPNVEFSIDTLSELTLVFNLQGLNCCDDSWRVELLRFLQILALALKNLDDYSSFYHREMVNGYPSFFFIATISSLCIQHNAC